MEQGLLSVFCVKFATGGGVATTICIFLFDVPPALDTVRVTVERTRVAVQDAVGSDQQRLPHLQIPTTMKLLPLMYQ